MTSLHGVDDSSMDEALFEFFKKQKIKELKSQLSASVLMDIKNQKGVVVGDFDYAHNEFGFKSRLQSAFGCSMNDKIIICVHLFIHVSARLMRLIFLLLLYENRHMKKQFCLQKENNIAGRVLFQSAEKHGVKLSNPKFDNQNSKSFINLELDEENMIHKTKEVTPIPNAIKTDGKGRNNAMNQGSSTLSFASEGFSNKHFAPDVGGAESPEKSSKFRVTPPEKKYYNAVCLLANSRFSKSVVVDIGGCNLKYFSLGDSLAPGHEVCTFIINCMCRKYFPDERPTISLKHYFFSCVSLLFPVLHGDHWFLFVVDLSNKLFLFLDSLFSKTDEFSCYTRKKLIVSFVHAWSLFVGSDPGFNKFRIAYPHVPKQRNKVDCGVFLIKFMEMWKFGGNLHEQFSQEDIPNIRIQILNDLLMSEHNKADWDVVRNYDGSGTITGTRK